MFNPNIVSKEIFNVLRSFDYEVEIFNDEGNRVYEPEEARRYFAKPKNIECVISEEGENSCVKLFLSHSTEVEEVQGLIDTLRMLCTRFAILFNVRKYDRELTLRDLSPHLDETSEYPFASETVKILVSEGAEGITKIVLEHIDGWQFRLPVNELHLARELVTKINEGFLPDSPEGRAILEAATNHIEGEYTVELTEAGRPKNVEMVELKALDGRKVEKAAWEAFKNDEVLELYRAPNYVRASRVGANGNLTVLRLQSIVPHVQADGMSNMLGYVAARLEDGDQSVLLKAIADRAIKATYPMEVLHEQEVEENCTVYSHECEDEELKESNSYEAFKNGDLILMNESIREFETWFGSLSETAIFGEALGDENLIQQHQRLGGDEGHDRAIDTALAQVSDEFDVDDYLASHGSDFNYGDEAEKQVHEDELRASIAHYIEMKVDETLGDEVDASLSAQVVDEKLVDVMDRLHGEGYEIVGSQLGLEGDDDFIGGKEVLDEFDCEEDYLETEDGEEKLLLDDASEELTQEDILLPKNPGEDFSNEVTVDHSDDYLERMKSLAGMKASEQPRLPQP